MTPRTGEMGLKSVGQLFADQQWKNSSSGGWERDFFGFLGLVKSWPSIVGETLSRQTLPLKIRSKKLFIMTSHPLYAQQLQHFEQTILERVTARFPRLRSQVGGIRLQATDYFDTIKTEQKIGLTATQKDQEKEQPQSFHPFDPRYLRLRLEVRAKLPPIADSELSALLEEVNIRYHMSWEDAADSD